MGFVVGRPQWGNMARRTSRILTENGAAGVVTENGNIGKLADK